MSDSPTTPNPNDLNALNAEGHRLFSQRKFAEAREWFRRVQKRAPNHPAPLLNQAICLKELGRNAEAIPLLRQAVAIDPQSLPALITLAELLTKTGAGSEAAPLFERAAQLDPNPSRGTLLLGQAHIEQNRFAEAERVAREFLAKKPNDGPVLELLGGVLKQLGRFEEALDAFAEAMKAMPDRVSLALDFVSCRKMTLSDRARLAEVFSKVDSPDLTSEQQISLHFAIAKYEDDVGEFAQAIERFDLAHEAARSDLVQKGQSYSDAQMRSRFQSIYSAYSASRLSRSAKSASRSSRPLFIVGMVRSGTTLVEQILTRHPDIASGGELSFWPQQWRSLRPSNNGFQEEDIQRLAADYLSLLNSIDPVAKRVTDKMPGNYIALGAIHAVFPNAKVIYCHREPIDNAVSIYTTPFQSNHNWIHRREDIVSFYRLHEELMDHWRNALPSDVLFEVEYEQLVQRPDIVVPKLIEFTGLDWDQSCLSPQENDRPVRTPSQWQVRQPVYRSSVGRWKNYEPWLGALAQLMPGQR